MRSTRNQLFCWQEKKKLAIIYKNYSGEDLMKLRSLYMAITEIESINDIEDIYAHDCVLLLSQFSGIKKEWIPQGIDMLMKIDVI